MLAPMEWPKIDEPELLDRMALDDAGFDAFMKTFVGALPSERTMEDGEIERALTYPWSRPSSSYVLEDERVTSLDDLEDRAGILERFTGPRSGRAPLLAIGANAAPERVHLKLAHFEDPEDRSMLVLCGDLHDFDVGPAAHPTGYGSMPATVFPSPGTRVRAAITWVTPAQLTLLTWTELSYWLGRLDTRFTTDEAGFDADAVLVFVSRLGVFSPEGQPVAMQLVPAEGRTAPALTQAELLDHAARLVLGDGADHITLLHAIFSDTAGTFERTWPALKPFAQPFASDRWTPFPTGR